MECEDVDSAVACCYRAAVPQTGRSLLTWSLYLARCSRSVEPLPPIGWLSVGGVFSSAETSCGSLSGCRPGR